MKLSRQALGLLTVLLIFAGLGTGIFWRLNREAEGTETEGAQGEVSAESGSAPASAAQFSTDLPQPVMGVEVVRDTLWIRVSANGRAAAMRRAPLNALVAGQVQSVPVQENTPVAAGRALVRIDSTEYALKVAAAESEVRNADATFRQTVLFDDEIEDPAVRDERQRIARAVSGLDQAEVALQEAHLNLNRTRVTAPFGGRVADLKVVTGQYVTEGTELLTLVDLDPIKIEAQVLEADLGLLEEGRTATVELTAAPGERFDARIVSINPLVDPQTGNARVTLHVPNRDGRIKPGMYARVSLSARAFADRVLVPREAILERDDRFIVFVYNPIDDERGRAEWRYVGLGRENDTMIEVVPNEDGSTVEPGEVVLVEGHRYLAHDSPIRLVDDLAPGEGRPGR